MRLSFFLSVLAGALSGCTGLVVPNVQEPFEDASQVVINENVILNQIRCEIHKGAQDAMKDNRKIGTGYGQGAQWLNNWVAKVALDLSVEEKGSLNPGLALIRPLPAGAVHFPSGDVTGGQLFNFGLGLSASSTATRVENIGVSYAIADLTKYKLKDDCSHEGKILIKSDLKIGEFIRRKAELADIPGNISAGNLSNPFDVLTYKATFAVHYGASANPAWTFLRIAVNPEQALLTSDRTKTHAVTVTMGPLEIDKKTGTARPSRDVEDAHLSSQIGQSVAQSLTRRQ